MGLLLLCMRLMRTMGRRCMMGKRVTKAYSGIGQSKTQSQIRSTPALYGGSLSTLPFAHLDMA
jgi:hypothetical protein